MLIEVNFIVNVWLIKCACFKSVPSFAIRTTVLVLLEASARLARMSSAQTNNVQYFSSSSELVKYHDVAIN